jgi:hypothetical protein
MRSQTLPCIRFGSPDSLDTDVVYVWEPKSDQPALLDRQVCKEFCRSEEENRNVILVSQGIVRDCYKGSPDEMNNALFATYGMHEQSVPNPIARPITRIVPLKVVRATRSVLSMISRTSMRDKVKQALHSYDQAQRAEVLRTAHFGLFDLEPAVAKCIAFQLGQLLALLHGDELYTKQGIAEWAPRLADLLYRKPQANLEPLNEIRDEIFAQLSEVYTRTQGTLNIFCYKNSVTVRKWGPYAMQSRGIIIDLKTERCVVFPFEKFFKLGEIPAWNFDQLPCSRPQEIVEKIDGSMVSAYRWDGQIHFAVKGNFEVEQSCKAREIAGKYPIEQLDFDHFDYFFEVVYPKNRFPESFAVVDYGEEALFLTGIRDKLTLEQLSYQEVQRVAQSIGMRYPKATTMSWEQVLASTQDESWQNFEGWVANFSGKLVKVKQQSYCQLNDIINGLKHGNSRVVRKYLSMSDEEWTSYTRMVPESLLVYVRQELAQVTVFKDELYSLLQPIFDRYSPENEQRFIDWVQQHIHPDYHRIIFNHLRRKDSSQILKRLFLRKVFFGGRKRSPIPWEITLAESPNQASL